MKKIITEFYTCGSTNEPEGMTFHTRGKYADGGHAFGSPNKGYLEEVVSEEYFYELQKKHLIKGMYGVIDAKTRKALDEKIAATKEAHCKQQCEANRINFKRAERDAKEFGEDHEALFTLDYPTVSEDVKAMLFAEARKAKLKATTKKSK